MEMEYIVLRIGGGHLATPNASIDAPVVRPVDPGQVSVSVASLRESEVLDLRKDPSIGGVAYPLLVSAIKGTISTVGSSARSDGESWGISAVGADKTSYTGSGVVVAVLDTGIKRDHPAFSGVELETANFTSDSPLDDDGHGTHCAGTIFGRATNDVRIGVAPGIRKALIGKVLGKNGGTTADVVRGINWAWMNGADIISMSLGFDFVRHLDHLQVKYDLPREAAISLALTHYRDNMRLFDNLSQLVLNAGEGMPNAVLVVAAGNESKREGHPPYSMVVAPPAASGSVLSVAALGRNENSRTLMLRSAPFSNVGARIAAPGVGVVSAALDNGLVAMDGTSMAAPHVAGVAALWIEHKTQKSGGRRPNGAEIVKLLEKNARELPDLLSAEVGCGLVQCP